MPEPDRTPSVSSLVLRAKQQEIDAVRLLADRAEFVATVGELVHLLQRERGASSAFLASKGERFAQVRASAVADVRPADARLRQRFAQQMAPAALASARLLSRMAWVLLGLDAVDELREQVGRQALSADDSVAAYSRVIAGLVELIFEVADAAPLPGISRHLVAFLHLVQGKEAAGQERAIGALLFASGQCSVAHQQRIHHLIDAQEHSLAVYAEFSEPAQRNAWALLQLAPEVAKLERLRRTLCMARPGATLDSNLSDTWFEVSSARIGTLWQLEIALVQQLRQACETQIRHAQQELADSEGLLRRLRDNPPPHAHAVDRFFDANFRPEMAPVLVASQGGAESNSLIELLQSQSAKLASMELALEAARRALHERKVIERAKGVLMSRMGMTEDAAFRALQKTSMDQNRRLLDVAEATLTLPDFAFPPRA